MFQQILVNAPDHVDANWGLALSYRKVGDRDRALSVFEKVRELVQTRLTTDSEDRARFVMLARMVAQQIEQMSAFI